MAEQISQERVNQIFERLSAVVTDIQTGASSPRTVVYEKSGPGHFTVRTESPQQPASSRTTNTADDRER